MLMDMRTTLFAYVRKHLTKILAPVIVLLFVGLVVVYDISLPSWGGGNQSIVVDCAKMPETDPLYYSECEDKEPLELSYEAAARRFATASIYDSDLEYILPTQSDMSAEPVATRGAASMVSSSPLSALPADARFYSHVPENSASWQSKWVTDDGTLYAFDVFMVPSPDAASKLHAVLVNEISGYGEVMVEVDAYLMETLAVKNSYTLLVTVVPGSCTLVTLTQNKNIVYSTLSKEPKDCQAADGGTHIHLVSSVTYKADLLLLPQ